MATKKLSRYARLLRDMTDAELAAEVQRPRQLLLESETSGGKRFDIAYWPHGPMNTGARIVIVGITAGRQQMRNAWEEMRRGLRAGLSEEDAATAADSFASFSGPMRRNLVDMLDDVGVHRLLGLKTTMSLWHDEVDLVQFMSVIRWPVFIDGENYRGVPAMFSVPVLRKRLMEGFAADASVLRDAIFVPLGGVVGEALDYVADEIGFDHDRVLSGLPHPSGANAERVAFFLGRKPQERLSTRLRPEPLIAARKDLKAKVKRLRRK